MKVHTAWTGLILSIMIGQLSRQVQGCVETFPSIANSYTECSNLTTTCYVNCTSDHIFYDGDKTKTYRCNNDTKWTPSVSKHSCVDKIHRKYWIQLNATYNSSQIAAFCGKAIDDNQLKFVENVSNICNKNETVAAGNIVISNITSWTASFNVLATITLYLTNSSTTKHAVDTCTMLLVKALQEGTLVLHNDTVQCTNGTSKITIDRNKIKSDIKQCNDSFVVTTNEGNTYCVLDLPVVGGTQILYSAYTNENITLHSEIHFGTSIQQVYWRHNENLIIPSNTKYSGGTHMLSSLTIYKLTKQDAGEYVCHVVNSQGEGMGPVVILEVLATSDVSTQQDQSTVTRADTSPETTSTDQTTRTYKKEAEDSKHVLYIAIGAGCGGLIIIIIILIIVITSCRKGSHQKERKSDNRKSRSHDGNNDPEYDGLKDNILYVQSDDGLKDNILYVPSEEHDITDGNYSSVDLERSPIKRVSVDENYSTVDLESPDNNLGSSYLNKGATNTNQDTSFVNKAFEINDENIKHIAAPDGTNNVYAVVDRKKNSSKNTDDPNGYKQEIAYAAVDKTKKH